MAFQGEHGPWRPPPALVPSCTHTAQDRCTRRGSTLAGRQSKTCQHTIKSRSSTEAQPQKVHVCQSHVGTHTHTHTHTHQNKQAFVCTVTHFILVGLRCRKPMGDVVNRPNLRALSFSVVVGVCVKVVRSFFFLLVHFPANTSTHTHAHPHATHTRTHTHTHTQIVQTTCCTALR